MPKYGTVNIPIQEQALQDQDNDLLQTVITYIHRSDKRCDHAAPALSNERNIISLPARSNVSFDTVFLHSVASSGNHGMHSFVIQQPSVAIPILYTHMG